MDRVFAEHLANYNKNMRDDIKDIEVRIENFENGKNNLDDILIHKDSAIKEYLKGNLGQNVGRGIQ